MLADHQEFSDHSFRLKELREMSLLFRIILGLLAGYIGSKIVNKRGEGLLRDSFLGITGALVAGFLFRRGRVLHT